MGDFRQEFGGGHDAGSRHVGLDQPERVRLQWRSTSRATSSRCLRKDTG